MDQDLYLYESIAIQLRRHIEGGSYQPGERLPSVRSLSRLFNTSVNTIIQCLRQLEQENYIEIRARSGTFVAACPPINTPEASDFELLPVEVSLSDDILHYMEPHHHSELVHLGIALPDPQLMPLDRIMTTLRDITRKQPLEVWDYSHPHGHPRFTMPEANKQKMVELATRYEIPIIENDVWGDTLYVEGAMPAKAYDHAGMVLYCHSFSKSLMPGMRLGWIAPGRFHHRLRELKLVSSITTASTPQLLMARLMESGFYAQHLLALRQQLATQSERVRQAVLEYFPPGTSVMQPSGGCVLWITLPPHMDASGLFDEALQSGIHIFPGQVFSPRQQYAHCLRLNVGSPVNTDILQAVRRLGDIARTRESALRSGGLR